jgi:putative membrane protein
MADQPPTSPSSNQLAQERTDLANKRTDLAQDRNDLAEERTRLAYERTLMAWVRTSTALISFGFTLYKFLDVLQDSAERQDRLLGPRGFAFMMIGIGLVALYLSIVDHRRGLKLLSKPFGPGKYSLAEIIAILVGALGLLGLFLVAFRW